MISEGVSHLLENAHPHSTLVLHGGDFVSAKTRFSDATPQRDFDSHAPIILDHLRNLPQIGVQGNHDEAHLDSARIMGSLTDTFGIHFLYTPDQRKVFEFDGSKIAVHGIHTLATQLKSLRITQRNELLDEYIRQFNT